MHDSAAEIATLDQMSTGGLAERYAKLHGQPCRTRHRAYLIRKIAWRIQANAEALLLPIGRAPQVCDDGDGLRGRGHGTLFVSTGRGLVPP